MSVILQLFGGRGASSGLFSYYLPKNPNKSQRLTDVTDSRQRANSKSRTYVDESNGLKVRFDKGESGKSGWRGTDHYHIYNPNASSWRDMYLDKNGNPCAEGSKESHIPPGEYENIFKGSK